MELLRLGGTSISGAVHRRIWAKSDHSLVLSWHPCRILQRRRKSSRQAFRTLRSLGRWTSPGEGPDFGPVASPVMLDCTLPLALLLLPQENIDGAVAAGYCPCCRPRNASNTRSYSCIRCCNAATAAGDTYGFLAHAGTFETPWFLVVNHVGATSTVQAQVEELCGNFGACDTVRSIARDIWLAYIAAVRVLEPSFSA